MIRAILLATALLAADPDGCDGKPGSDRIQAAQQEVILAEGTRAVGMPAIKNFQERKLLKDILELRDQTNLATYTYVWSEMKGRGIFLCDSLGFGLPYATQFTNPQKDIYYGTTSQVHMALPQADPNGLFSPAAAEGTWVMCVNPKGKDISPIYVEPRIIVSTFKLPIEE
jgi:hypothetical protein